MPTGDYTIGSLVEKIVELVINPLITLLMIVGTVVFLWGLVEFLMNPDNEEKRSAGKRHMIWGIVGLFLMVSVWGIIQILCDFFETCQILGI
ncbi:MAG: hypothetical protein HY445_01040 [Candidatus Niyogibacteria bacterium]|nr:hypothetical protein [Candidatus Niyogibacteria bacterium]